MGLLLETKQKMTSNIVFSNDPTSDGKMRQLLVSKVANVDTEGQDQSAFLRSVL